MKKLSDDNAMGPKKQNSLLPPFPAKTPVLHFFIKLL